MTSDQRTAIVIGGGLVGCTTAYYLAQDGWSVRLLERDHIGSGASSGNCGFVCPSHVMPLAVPGAVARTLRSMMGRDAPIHVRWRLDWSLWSWFQRFAARCRTEPMMDSANGRHALLKSSMELYRKLIADEGIDCQWEDQGLLMVYKSQHDFNQFRKMAAILKQEFGVLATPFVGDSVVELEPTLRCGLAGGWLFPGDAHIRPERLLASLRKVLKKYQVLIEEKVAVHTLTIQDKRVRSVETSGGPRSAELVVLATGAEAPTFSKSLRCKIPIQPGKGYSLTTRVTGKIPRIPMIFEEHHVAVTPFEESLRIGSTMEFTGYDRTINRNRLALLQKSAKEHLNELPDMSKVDEWAGWRPMIYDGLPCIDRAPGAENVIVAAGNGMIGLASAPATGKLVAQLASQVPPHIDPRPYSLGRF